ncbi:MAG: NifB/NifX family molybdenum-iron cluster-binding protein [Deltaproteobacteria bacterium]|nr:NifB/NifX family molybdenum-iron cluster-binding protein [Deltaproteobacteria bacterium]
MKVAVSATGSTLDAAVDSRFGRCSAFVLVETDDMSYEVVENAAVGRAGGAGIRAGELLAHKGVRVLLTGNCGPNAYETLKAAGIDVFVGCHGTVAEAIRSYKLGQLQPASSPNVASHAGMGGGRR